MSKRIEPGKRLGMWTVLNRAPRRRNNQYWLCRCECGAERSVSVASLTAGTSTNCGCRKPMVVRALQQPAGQRGFRMYKAEYSGSAKRRGLEFSLTDEQLYSLSQQDCYYCGQHPSREVTPHYRTAETRAHAQLVVNGIDRVDSSRGYTPDNCVSACTPCNVAKMDMSYTDFVAFIQRVSAFLARRA